MPFVHQLAAQLNNVIYRLGTSIRLAVAICLAIFGLQALADDTPPDDSPYRFGDGLRIPGTGLRLGGYATASYENSRQQPARTALDNASLFVWWEGEGRWKFFSELDLENVLSYPHSTTEAGDRYLALERLYVDYAFTDTTTIRGGKYLTPIGRWNLIHATPLVWTTARPMITSPQVFPGNVTGLMLSGALPMADTSIEYSLYASNGREVRPNPDIDPFNDVIGGHATLALPRGGQLGISYAIFEQKKTRDERKQLLGLDFLWSRNRFEVSAEGIYRFSDNGSAWDEKGGFMQLVAPLTEKLYAVGRYEIFRKAQEPNATQLWLTGLNYRITPAIVLKAEWIASRNNHIGAPDGFMSSVSILF